MKRIVLSLLLCSVALLSIAQKKLYYCEVKGIEKELTSGLKIVFDFGEKASYNMWGDLSSKLKFVDEDGAEIKFNSMVVDCLSSTKGIPCRIITLTFVTHIKSFFVTCQI